MRQAVTGGALHPLKSHGDTGRPAVCLRGGL